MNKVFDRLEYNFESKGNQVVKFGADAKRTMNSVPKFLDDWQFEALGEGDTDGYVQNPVKDVTNSIITICGQIISSSNASPNLSSIISVSGTIISNSGPEFIEHTDRISGMVEPNEDTSLLPHYDTAMAIGKSLTYIVNQAGDLDDNATIMGSFTSIVIGEDLTDYRDAISVYPALIAQSLYPVIISGTDGEGNPVEETVYYTTLTPAQLTQILNDVTAISDMYTVRKAHDENFFTKSKMVLDDFNKLKKFKDMGQTERNLTQNFIGTEKLLSKTGN
jgi:hypothetical protein